MQKMGSFGVVRGHSRSTAMSPFDRAHTTSYSTLIGRSNFAEIFGIRKLESLGYRVVLFV